MIKFEESNVHLTNVKIMALGSGGLPINVLAQDQLGYRFTITDCLMTTTEDALAFTVGEFEIRELEKNEYKDSLID